MNELMLSIFKREKQGNLKPNGLINADLLQKYNRRNDTPHYQVSNQVSSSKYRESSGYPKVVMVRLSYSLH